MPKSWRASIGNACRQRRAGVGSGIEMLWCLVAMVLLHSTRWVSRSTSLQIVAIAPLLLRFAPLLLRFAPLLLRFAPRSAPAQRVSVQRRLLQPDTRIELE